MTTSTVAAGSVLGPDGGAGVGPRRSVPSVLVVAVLLTVAAVALHVNLWQHAGPLWRDEINSVVLANSPTRRELWTNLHYDSFPLLWHLILRAWTGVVGGGGVGGDGSWGGSAVGTRGLGLVAGLGVIAALWRNARRFGGRAPVVGLLLTQFTSAFVVHGDSVRAYGLSMCAALFTLGLIWDVAEGATAVRTIVALAVALASVHLAFYNSVLLLACCVGGSVVAGRGRHWGRVAAVLGIGATCGATMLVYVPVIARARAYTKMLITPWTWRHTGLKLAEALVPTTHDPATALLPEWFMIVAWAVLFAGGVALAVAAGVARPAWWARLPGRRRAAFLYAAVTGAAGLVLYVGFLRVLQYEMQPWYFVTGLALIAGCLDPLYGIATPGRPRLALAVAALGAALLLVPNLWVDTSVRKTGIDRIADALRDLVAPGDCVVVTPWYYAIPVGYYYHGSAPVVPVPPVPFIRYHRYDQLVPFMVEPRTITPFLVRVGDVLRDGHRVWLVADNLNVYGFHGMAAAPSPAYGWSSMYYEMAWRDLLLTYLIRHHVTAEQVGPDRDRRGAPLVSPYENPGLYRVSGWHK